MKTKDMVLCALFTVLIALGAFIKIPIPVVPFTLQFLFTLLAGLLLGSRLGAISVASFMLLLVYWVYLFSPKAVAYGIF
jgi:biotin transport system substrate-specific component